jgi:IS5 family transposase
MFKILILKTLYNLSDEHTELLISDRLSFREFLGLSFSDTIPEARTIWLFAELLKEQDRERHLFDLFHEELARHGLAAKGGCSMDGTFVEVPKQHNTPEENAEIKRGSIPKQFTSDPHVGAHKDTDARWGRKNKEKHYGYKNHVLADSDTKLILDYEVTDASVHDSIPCLDLMPPEPRYPGQEVHLDSA